MRPLDPRLLRRAQSARRYVLLTAGLGGLTAAAVVAQALLLARALSPVVLRTADWPDVAPLVGWLALVVASRALLTAVQERFAHRAATRAMAELREQVLAHSVALGPRWIAAHPGVATLATRGLDALDPYFVRYLPQLLLAATVTPATLAVVLAHDVIAAITIALTLPLIPVFMVLIGRMTQGYADRRLAAMTRLGHQVLDLLAGLPTLRALGRERGPERQVAELGDAHRRATMGTLRVAFLSGMTLELLTTISVALVAVGIGFRLVFGDLDLVTGLAVLVLAPEVYLPLRQVGAHFHASADGVAAAEQVFAVLEEPAAPHGELAAPDLSRTVVRLRGVAGRRARPRAPGTRETSTSNSPPARWSRLPGRTAPGKSTTVAVLLGLLAPDSGEVLLTPDDAPGVRLAEVDPSGWWAQIAWVPQRPVIEPGTVREAVERGTPATDERLAATAALTGLDAVVADLPDGWLTRVGQGGAGLSLGQRQRLALTRALLAPAPLVVLDEPTAHLDADGERVVLDDRAAAARAGPHGAAGRAPPEPARGRRPHGDRHLRNPGGLMTRDPLWRAVRLLEVDPRRVLGAVAAGAGGLGSAVALAAISGWLIARAAQMPSVAALSVAAVAVRLFGISRGVLRYVERLVSHDVALRGMATLRVRLYERLAEGTPAGLLALRRGDLLARVGADVDAVGDVVVRGLLPMAVAAVVGLGSAAAMAVFLPTAGLTLLACLLLAGVAGTLGGAARARAPSSVTPPRRAPTSPR